MNTFNKKPTKGGLLGQLRPPPFMDMSDPNYIGINPAPPMFYMDGGVVVEQEVHKRKKTHPFKRMK